MDKLTKQRRSWNMSRIKGINTKPELQLRKLLYNAGYRYRIHYKIKGRPDIVFPGKRIAIFIHGCFWHQHGCTYSTIPKSNTEFWKNKLEGNVQRDKRINQELKEEKWSTVTIWECQIEHNWQHTVSELINYLQKSGIGKHASKIHSMSVVHI